MNKNKLLKIILIAICFLYSHSSLAALKQLYLEGLGGAPFLTRLQPANQSFVNLTAGSSITAGQTLPFQAPFTILATDLIVNLNLQKLGGGNAPTAEVEVFINGTGGTSLGTDQFTLPKSGKKTTHPFVISNAVAHNLAAGDYLTVVIRNIAGGLLRVRQTTAAVSYLEVNTNTVISVDGIGVHTNPYPNPEEFLSYTASTTVYLRATVSDPFGFADISSVDFTVNDPNAPPSVFTANIQTPVAGATGATAVFETPYSIPPIPAPDGVWSLDVVAHEGSEGTVTDTASKSFSVGSPALNVRKASFTDYDPVNINSSAKAIPNSRVEYTVEVTNSGFGFVDNNSIFISDVLPSAQSTFYFGVPADPVQFTDGAVASGLNFTFIDIASAADDVQFSNDGCVTFVAAPTADPVTGYDTTSPKIDCIEINPKGDFKGSDGINNPSFSVTFTIKVD